MGEEKRYRLSRGLNIMEIGQGRYSVYVEAKQKNYVIGEKEFQLIRGIEENQTREEIVRSCPDFSEKVLWKGKTGVFFALDSFDIS